MNRNRFLVGVLGLTLLFGPWLAAATGARSDAIKSENRALATKPELRGFKTLDDITSYTADHFPLRDNAIAANKKLGNVAGSGSAPKGPAGVGASKPAVAQPAITTPTVKGKTDPWLFLSEDFNRACDAEIDLDEAIAGLRRLNDIITNSGRRFVFTIVPDKSTFQTQMLPSTYPLRDCSREVKADRRKRLAAMKLPNYLDMLPSLKADERSRNELAYLPRDSHWSDRSGGLFVKAMAEKIDPRVASNTELKFLYTAKRADDLSILEGDSSLHDYAVWDLAREGVTPNTVTKPYAHGEEYDMRTVRATTTGPARLITDKTFWIGDSFSDHAVHHFEKYFADMVEMPDLTKAKSTGRGLDGKDLYDAVLPTFIQHIVDSKIIVMEAVERFFFGRADGSLVTKDFLDRLEAALR